MRHIPILQESLDRNGCCRVLVRVHTRAQTHIFHFSNETGMKNNMASSRMTVDDTYQVRWPALLVPKGHGSPVSEFSPCVSLRNARENFRGQTWIYDPGAPDKERLSFQLRP